MELLYTYKIIGRSNFQKKNPEKVEHFYVDNFVRIRHR